MATETNALTVHAGHLPVYSKAVRDEIIDRMSRGELLVSILQSSGMPSREVVYEWAQTEAWADEFSRARNLGIDAMAERALLVSQDFEREPACRKTEIDVLLRLAARMAPNRWGDRTALQMLDEHGKPAKAGITIIVDGAPEEQ